MIQTARMRAILGELAAPPDEQAGDGGDDKATDRQRAAGHEVASLVELTQ